MKRIISALLCVVMILSLSPVTFAEETYSITVNGVTFMSDEDIPVGKYEGWSYNSGPSIISITKGYPGGSIRADGFIHVYVTDAEIIAEEGEAGVYSSAYLQVTLNNGTIKGGDSLSERAGAALQGHNVYCKGEGALEGGSGSLAGYAVSSSAGCTIYGDVTMKAGLGEDRHAIHNNNNSEIVVSGYSDSIDAAEITAEKEIYTVTVDLNGGHTPSGETTLSFTGEGGNRGFDINRDDYIRDGYLFLGLSEDKDSTIPNYVNSYSFSQNITLYAVWLKVNPGDVVLADTYRVIDGNSTPMPDTAKIYGRTADVAFWSENGYSRFVLDRNVTATYGKFCLPGELVDQDDDAIILYPYEKDDDAKYLFFSADNGLINNISSSVAVETSNSSFRLFDENEITSNNGSLSGWATEKGGEVVYKPGESIPVDAGVHQFYAVYKEKVIVTLTVNANGGTFSDGSTQKNDQFQSSDYCPIFAYCFNGMISKDGYILRGFATDKNASVPDYSTNDGFYIGDKDIDLYAIWMKLEPGDIAIFENGESDGKYKLYHNETVVLPKETDYYGNNQEITGYKTYSNNTTDNSTFTGRWYLPGETISPDSEKGVALFAYTGEYYLYHLGEGLTDTGSKYVVTRNNFSNLKTPYIDGYRGANQIIPPEGKKLVGWATEEGGEIVYKPGEAIESSDEIRHFYAVYKETRDTVIFDGHEFKYNEMVERNTYGNWYYQVTNGEGYLYIFDGSYGEIDSPEDIVVYSMGNNVTINADEGKPAVKADGEVSFNGGSVTINGNIEADSVWSNSDMTISGSIRVKNGASFDNSNSTIDAGAGNEPYVSESGAEITSPNATITKADGKITIAVNPFTIVIDGNGGVNKNGEGRTEWTYTKHVASGGDLQLYDGMFTRDGFTQVGWETLDNLFHSISETFYRIYDTFNIKAVWEALTGVRDVYVFSGRYSFEDGSYYKRLGEDEELPASLKNGNYSIDTPIWINGGYNWDNGAYIGDFYFAGDTVKAEPGELIKLKPFNINNPILYDYTDGTHDSGKQCVISQKWNSAPRSETATGNYGYMLVGWSRDPNRNTIDFEPGASVSSLPDGLNRLYAVWKEDNRIPLGKPSSVDVDEKTFSISIKVPDNELGQNIVAYRLILENENRVLSEGLDYLAYQVDEYKVFTFDNVLKNHTEQVKSGTYRFEAYLKADGIEYRDGEKVTYTFDITTANIKLKTPKIPHISKTYNSYTLDNLIDYDGGYEIDYGYLSEDGIVTRIKATYNGNIRDRVDEQINANIESIIKTGYSGKIVIKVRNFSKDYSSAQSSEWSDWSDPIKIEAVNSEVKNAVLSAISLPKEPEEKDKQAAVEAIKEIDTEELKKAIEIETSNNVSNGGQGEIVRNIENLEVLTGKTAEKQVAEDLSEVLAADEIKVVGAGLNAEEGKQITLEVKKAEKEDVYPTLVNQSVRISIDLVDSDTKESVTEDKKELAVPVVIKLPIPKTINPSFLKIIHYHDDGTTEKIYPTITRERSASSQKMIWYATFVVSSFSDFELVDNAAIKTVEGVKVSIEATSEMVYAAAYDENGKFLGHAMLSVDNNGVASGTITCESDKASTVKFFIMDNGLKPISEAVVYAVTE